MSENYPNTDQSLPNLQRKNRRARLASLFSGIPGVLTGGMVAGAAYEAYHAQPADAGTEAAMAHEAQSPQGFIKTFNHNFALATDHMEASSHYKVLSVDKVNKITKSKVVFKIISVPSREYAGKFDILNVAVQNNEAVPDSAQIFVGANSPSIPQIKDWEHSYYVTTTAGPGVGKWLGYEQDNGPTTVTEAQNFFVNGAENPGLTPDKNHVLYTQNPKRVSAAYNGFLHRMRTLTAQK